ncbi:hypothetical protein [Nocardia thraciensis]
MPLHDGPGDHLVESHIETVGGLRPSRQLTSPGDQVEDLLPLADQPLVQAGKSRQVRPNYLADAIESATGQAFSI